MVAGTVMLGARSLLYLRTRLAPHLDSGAAELAGLIANNEAEEAAAA